MNTSAEQITVLEKAAKATEEIRQRAVARKDIYEVNLKEKDKQVEAYGIRADEGEAEIERIDAEIARRITELKPKIPFQLLLDYKQLTPEDLRVLGIQL